MLERTWVGSSELGRVKSGRLVDRWGGVWPCMDWIEGLSGLGWAPSLVRMAHGPSLARGQRRAGPRSSAHRSSAQRPALAVRPLFRPVHPAPPPLSRGQFKLLPLPHPLIGHLSATRTSSESSHTQSHPACFPDFLLENKTVERTRRRPARECAFCDHPSAGAGPARVATIRRRYPTRAGPGAQRPGSDRPRLGGFHRAFGALRRAPERPGGSGVLCVKVLGQPHVWVCRALTFRTRFARAMISTEAGLRVALAARVAGDLQGNSAVDPVATRGQG